MRLPRSHWRPGSASFALSNSRPTSSRSTMNIVGQPSELVIGSIATKNRSPRGWSIRARLRCGASYGSQRSSPNFASLSRSRSLVVVGISVKPRSLTSIRTNGTSVGSADVLNLLFSMMSHAQPLMRLPVLSSSRRSSSFDLPPTMNVRQTSKRRFTFLMASSPARNFRTPSIPPSLLTTASI